MWEMKSPLEMVDALISDYVTLLGTRRFSHLPKRKYIEGFQKLRQTYIDQYPEVFEAKRKAWDE